jgi:hypothetical protein
MRPLQYAWAVYSLACLPGVYVCGVVWTMLKIIGLDARCSKETLSTWAPRKTSVDERVAGDALRQAVRER